MPIQFISICDGNTRVNYNRVDSDAAPHRLLDVLGAVTHLELAEIPLDLAEDIILAEILIVDLRASIVMPR